MLKDRDEDVSIWYAGNIGRLLSRAFFNCVQSGFRIAGMYVIKLPLREDIYCARSRKPWVIIRERRSRADNCGAIDRVTLDCLEGFVDLRKRKGRDLRFQPNLAGNLEKVARV